MTSSRDWEIPRQIWAILLSWGIAVLVLTSLLSWWIWSNEREQARENLRLQREKDRAMCVMLDLITSGPPPVAGPAGDRARAVVGAIGTYRKTLDCDAIISVN